jgi:peptidoglycan/xylan/chitin deacetylase (PgdA/CDA1 family)
MMRPLLSVLSPAGDRARLSILIFHRVLAQPDPLFPDEPDACRFDDICRWVARWFNVLPLDQACRRLRDATLPSRALAITFDDGYADNHDIALPILQRHGLTATFFVATGFLDGGRMWNDTLIEALRRTSRTQLDLTDCGVPGLELLDLATIDARRQAIGRVLRIGKYLDAHARVGFAEAVARVAGAELPTDLMMLSSQVTALRRAGMCVGGHTVTHPILARLDRAAAREEISQNKTRLESLTQAPVSLFAYPNGVPGRDYGPVSIELVREAGFEAAVSTAWGAADKSTEPFQLPRFTPWDRSRGSFGLRLVRNLRANCITC